ncbi:MAG TPA: response regulator transcription factor [Candidatus Angelobacter sp.]|nr:response regulator transcription factor [Candidatus Angelobacter sp.]
MATAVEPVFSSIPTEQASVQTGTKRIRTVVVDDSETFLQVVCALLELDSRVDVVARADKGGEAIETVMKLRPDLILMDVYMPYLDGLTLAWFFLRRFPSARVVLMSTENTPELRAACEESGAMDFIHKENFRDEFRAVLARVSGEEWQGTELNAIFSS